MKFDSMLEKIIFHSLDVDDYDLTHLATWARRSDLPEQVSCERDTFKAELARSLQEPYTVTPQLFEQWTRVDVETRQDVQAHLQEIWDACFEPN